MLWIVAIILAWLLLGFGVAWLFGSAARLGQPPEPEPAPDPTEKEAAPPASTEDVLPGRVIPFDVHSRRR
ncbi:MAG: hypothetical protein ACKO6N_11655 [Myxococcota bacterium]